jgi:hypothetical protein
MRSGARSVKIATVLLRARSGERGGPFAFRPRAAHLRRHNLQVSLSLSSDMVARRACADRASAFWPGACGAAPAALERARPGVAWRRGRRPAHLRDADGSPAGPRQVARRTAAASPTKSGGVVDGPGAAWPPPFVKVARCGRCKAPSGEGRSKRGRDQGATTRLRSTGACEEERRGDRPDGPSGTAAMDNTGQAPGFGFSS